MVPSMVTRGPLPKAEMHGYPKVEARIETLQQRYGRGEINANAFLQGIAYVLGEKI